MRFAVIFASVPVTYNLRIVVIANAVHGVLDGFKVIIQVAIIAGLRVFRFKFKEFCGETDIAGQGRATVHSLSSKPAKIVLPLAVPRWRVALLAVGIGTWSGTRLNRHGKTNHQP